MRATVVLMVIRVEFTDGTVFDDEAVYNALCAFLEDLQFKLERLEYLEKKRK
ncbi:MAG TPA: hypothetical protein VNO50_17320 [Pyrinomonadaceae bacterium]|nr:hypothetical protein [Pyrinomonadaceae bacterium]